MLSPERSCDTLVQVHGVSLSKRSVTLVMKLQQVLVSPPEPEPESESESDDDWMMEDYGFTQ